MGLTNKSVAKNAAETKKTINKMTSNTKTVALAGNPNVGKSTVFNALTGMNQHTGNWPGKTVAVASGTAKSKKNSYTLVDLPGTYSLLTHSEEEKITESFLSFSEPDITVVICDATCLERNLNLALQIMEISQNVIVCVNLIDEAKRKNITLDLKKIEKRLGTPVIGITARNKKHLNLLLDTIDKVSSSKSARNKIPVEYAPEIEKAIHMIMPYVKKTVPNDFACRKICLNLLTQSHLISEYNVDFLSDKNLCEQLKKAHNYLNSENITEEILKDKIVSALVEKAEEICLGAITYPADKSSSFDRKADKILTGRLTGYPLMLLLLLVVFWITITGANYPSSWLSAAFTKIEHYLYNALIYIGLPEAFCLCLSEGVWRVLSWVVSVMLPPMAIFFPFFTILEDSGYLPRVAYNLDKTFHKCGACGKQALTMCMGFGCNAAGVVGARIIDSKRERLLAILTNSFIPCNGKFPTIISIISMFFIWTNNKVYSSFLSAALLTVVILFGILSTFFVTWLLSKTLLKGTPSSFILELPPYRKPQIGKVIVRSVFDRTLFVLGRAICMAAPAGLIIWLLSNVTINDVTLLNTFSSFLDPFAKIMGLDGVILLAFILGFPANEIVVPIMLMTYMSLSSVTELPNLVVLKDILVSNGWTYVTAINTMIFSLMHFPCSTTLMTIKKETGSFKWTILSAAIPTFIGIILCSVITLILS